MTPEALRRRMAHGNIYPPRRSTPRSANYFRPGNLGALRELALLWVADRVDEAPRRTTASATASTGPGRRASGSSSRSPARPAASGSSGAPPAWPARRRATSSACTCGRRTASPRPPPSCSSEHRELLEELGGALPRGRRRRRRRGARSTFARAENATQLVLGASRRSRWYRAHARLGHQPRDRAASGVGIDVHVISHADDGSEATQHAPRRRRRRAPPAPRAARLGARRRRPARRSRWLLAHLARARSACRRAAALPRCSSSPSPRSGASGRRSPRPSAASCSSTGSSRRRSTRSRSPRARTWSRSSSSSPWPRSSARFVDARGAARRRGARARAEARRWRSWPGSSCADGPTCSTASARCFGLDARRRAAHRRRRAGRVEALGRPAPARRRRTARRHRRSTSATCSCWSERRRREPTSRVLDAFAAQLAACARERRAAGRGGDGRGPRPRPNELRTAILLGRLARPAHAARVDQGVGHEPAARTTSPGPPRRPREFLDTIDEETDRLNALVGNLLDMSRLQTGALQRALHAGRARGGRRRARSPASARAPVRSTSTSPRRCRACSPTPACSSGPSRT